MALLAVCPPAPPPGGAPPGGAPPGLPSPLPSSWGSPPHAPSPEASRCSWVAACTFPGSAGRPRCCRTRQPGSPVETAGRNSTNEGGLSLSLAGLGENPKPLVPQAVTTVPVPQLRMAVDNFEAKTEILGGEACSTQALRASTKQGTGRGALWPEQPLRSDRIAAQSSPQRHSPVPSAPPHHHQVKASTTTLGGTAPPAPTPPAHPTRARKGPVPEAG